MGKISPVTHPGNKTFIAVFIDDYSRFAMAYPMKSKDETGFYLEKFLKSARNILGEEAKLCYLRADKGTEFTGGYTSEVLKRENAEFKTSAPDTPRHNGVSERFNGVIQEKIRAYMLDSRLPSNMWDLALEAAVYIYNRLPHRANNFVPPLPNSLQTRTFIWSKFEDSVVWQFS